MTTSAVPARKLAVLACMDARLDPAQLLDLRPGDAHVVRNAGGVVSDDAVRSLAISQHELGTEEIIVIQHTDCGLLKLDNDAFTAKLTEQAGASPTWHPHAFDDLDEHLRESVQRLRDSPFIPHKNVRGYVFEVESGRLREVS
jgi:carbonic anhydrase